MLYLSTGHHITAEELKKIQHTHKSHKRAWMGKIEGFFFVLFFLQVSFFSIIIIVSSVCFQNCFSLL